MLGWTLQMHQPYSQPEANTIYNLLFCDDLALFKPAKNETDWQKLLFAKKPDAGALLALAEDEHTESRVRALAYRRLRALGQAVPARKLLGIVIEVPLDNGLDALAAYAEGRVRYINATGKISIFENVTAEMQTTVHLLLMASQQIVDRIGPWDKARLPPPAGDHVRLTFIVSDGLYFGEGPFAALSQDALAGPLMEQATRLLQQVVALTTNR
jgi:hypothetical protein